MTFILLICVIGYCLSPSFCIVQELLQGDLRTLLIDWETILNWDFVLRVAIDIAKGLNFLHRTYQTRVDVQPTHLLCVEQSPPIIHLDIKPCNIFPPVQDGTTHIIAKIGDFGTAQILR